MNEKQNFTEGKIIVPLLLFAGPVLAAMFLQAMYGAVDLLIIGRFATTEDVSAVATGSLLMQSLTGILISFSVGVTVLLGQRIGQKRGNEAGEIIGNGIFLFAIISLVLTLLFVPGAGILSAMLNAPVEAFKQTTSYIRVQEKHCLAPSALHWQQLFLWDILESFRESCSQVSSQRILW